MAAGGAVSVYNVLLVHLLSDVVGYGLHGLGLVPIAAHADGFVKTWMGE